MQYKYMGGRHAVDTYGGQAYNVEMWGTGRVSGRLSRHGRVTKTCNRKSNQIYGA